MRNLNSINWNSLLVSLAAGMVLGLLGVPPLLAIPLMILAVLLLT